MTGILILAAGSSSRLGQPKQQLIYNGKTLLQHAVDAAADTRCEPIILVLGADSQYLPDNIFTQNITVVNNENWQQGMATSMQAGLEKALALQPALDHIIITLCDQPFVTANFLNSLIEYKANTPKNIVASAYNNTVGPPVLFSNKYFSQLRELHGDEGAKKLILQNEDDVETIAFEAGKYDIDTPADYEALLKHDLPDKFNAAN